MVIIEDRVERLNPFRVNISVVDDPADSFVRLFHYLSGTCCEHTILEFTSVVIHKTKELLSGHRLGVHHVSGNGLTHLLISHFQNLPDSGLSTSGRSNNNYSHSLFSSLVELQDLLHLLVDILELEFLYGLLDSCSELLHGNIFSLNSGEHIVLEGFVKAAIFKSQFRNSVDSDRLDQN
jgi:hypothetical protein